MQIYEELKARGLIAQVTDEEEIRELVNNGKATFYIGFDPTADSLHVGHFMALCLMKRLQMAGGNSELAEYKWVRLIEFVEEMPKTISGKIRKAKLREDSARAAG